jgi:hypothetical protein
MNDIVYDLETYPNCFLAGFKRVEDGMKWTFEVSDWVNQSKELTTFLTELRNNNYRMIGFNNIGFDYPILHMLIKMGSSSAKPLYDKAMAIIGSQYGQDRWAHGVKKNDWYVEQIDLFKIHHFDNVSKATSLKLLEFNMRMDNIEDLPFPVGQPLNQQQIKVLKEYMFHDIEATERFFFETKPMIKLREELSLKYNRDFMNHNDTKIGKDYFIMQLENSGVQCYEYGAEGRKPRQTKRPNIHLKEAILPWIHFENPEFERVVTWLRAQTITETKGVFKDLIAQVGGLDFVFGLGGIHASLNNEVIVPKDDEVLLDIDVESYYPSTAIAQRFRPAHYPELFCDIYAALKTERKKHKKGSAENAVFKLALNGVYGDTNQAFSVFYDPLMTMKITLNGQLLLCLLAERLMSLEGFRLVQVNTDGMTAIIKKNKLSEFRFIVQWWEWLTNLKMEESEYSRMFIKDVNNYLAEYK